MKNNRRATSFITLAMAVVAAVAVAQFGCSSSPTAPTTTAAVSGVTLNPTSVAAGSSGQGTVSLTTAASAGGASISLSSSNPAVATVQTPVAIQAGSTSATFTVVAVAAGTATITASFNGRSSQSPMLTVTGQSVALSSISLSSSSVVGGKSVTGTATLTAAAPAGGAAVLLSGADPVTVPASVTVLAGSASATFTIWTRAVGDTIAGTISGSYGGASASAVLSITQPPVATASFGVTGPTETETCTLANNGATLNCTFNGSTSTAPGKIIAWDWSYRVATTFTQTTSGPQLTMPSVDCSLLPAPPLPPGTQWFALTVTLKIHDDLGNVSAEFVDSGARLFPQGSCGF
jgi:trimeric autotransporter adhesin